MINPWLTTPSVPPFVLAQDAELVNRFNRTAPLRTRLRLDLLPEPFQGGVAAPVVLLGLNPGVSSDDPAIHARPDFARILRSTLAHEPIPFPFYLLNPDVSGPGREWWDRKLASVLKVVPRQILSERLLSIEYAPYHSEKFGHPRMVLPSQRYGFYLVREAMSRNAVIILMRGRRLWYNAVPELERYSGHYTLQSVQNVTISPRNCPQGFEPLLAALSRAS